jgi:hypothetical protein
MKMPMDLGYKMDGPSKASMPDKMYPSLHLEWPTEYDLPDSGEMTVTFRKTHESKSKGQGGKPRYTVDLEIRSIDSVEEGDEATPDDETEESGSDALDRHAAEMSDKENY